MNHAERVEMNGSYAVSGYVIVSKVWGVLRSTFGRTLEECWSNHDQQAGADREAWKADSEDPRDAVPVQLSIRALASTPPQADEEARAAEAKCVLACRRAAEEYERNGCIYTDRLGSIVANVVACGRSLARHPAAKGEGAV